MAELAERVLEMDLQTAPTCNASTLYHPLVG